ncbi:MAG: hypothetical protein MUO76_06865, partial [Anaerolineaceae bacterium]|nr:hypothetical protein [Anaerolineaceae bacterium]
MSKSPKKIVPSSGGFIHELALRIKLIIRLIMDKRVNIFLKFIPVASLIYLFNPIDIPGPLDDAAVVGLGMYMFIELCPPGIVEEHLNELRSIIPGELRDSPVDETVV